jgi:PHD/YefM family antitoxin component YafN of YafNO toxin-antitoxin module
MNYNKIYYQIIDKARNRTLEGYKEKHHIVPRCIGGNNEKENLVNLTSKEHFICHLLLCKMYPNENCLKSARWAMVTLKNKNHKRGYSISASQYERYKEEMSLTKKGKPRDEATKEKISNSKKGKTLSSLTKKKISDKMKGKVQSEEHKLNQSLSKKGQIPWNKGKLISEETKRKISLTRKKG